MTTRKAVLIEQSSRYYEKMFLDAGFSLVSDLVDADLVCFTGGEDVDPALYGHPVHPRTGYSKVRDKACVELYSKAQYMGLPCVGICRGGQFLNVMNGGTMVQDVRGHCRDHKLEIRIDNAITTVLQSSSTHHQMMMPGPFGEVIGHSPECNGYGHQWWSGKEFTGFGNRPVDNEIILYEGQQVLCFQPHPEFPGYFELRKAFFECLKLITGPVSD